VKEVDRKSGYIKKRLNKYKSEEIAQFKNEIVPLIQKEFDRQNLALIKNVIIDWYGRYNINEELERIGMHGAEITELLKKGGSAGKKIEFFSQELLREINTIASKCSDFKIRSYSVDIKNEIENIKEQVRNLC